MLLVKETIRLGLAVCLVSAVWLWPQLFLAGDVREGRVS
jgi:hypothetical protein